MRLRHKKQQAEEKSQSFTHLPKDASTPRSSQPPVEPTSRSSERIRKKRCSEFQMPCRHDVLDKIDNLPANRSLTYHKPRRHVNNLVKVNSRYNYDADLTDSDGSLDDFIVQPYEEGSSDGDDDDDDENDSSQGCHRLASSDEEQPQASCQSSQGAGSGEDLPVRHLAKRNRSSIIESDASSSDDSISPVKKRNTTRVISDSESEQGDSGMVLQSMLGDDDSCTLGCDLIAKVPHDKLHLSDQCSLDDRLLVDELEVAEAVAIDDAYEESDDSIEEVITPVRHSKSCMIDSDSDSDPGRLTSIKTKPEESSDSDSSCSQSDLKAEVTRSSRRSKPWDNNRRERKKLFNALRKKAALKTSKIDCECGRTQQTPRHLLLECQLFTLQRQAMFDSIDLLYVKHNTPFWERTVDLKTLLWPAHSNSLTVSGVEIAVADFFASLPAGYDIGV